MEVVLDSNVLFKILISQGEILELIFNNDLNLLAPLKLKQEFLNNKKEILSKSKLPENEFKILCSLIFSKITFVPLEKYKESLIKAKQLLETHTKDEDFIALCLSRDILLWTYESLLFKIGVGISTKQISEELSKNSKDYSSKHNSTK